MFIDKTVDAFLLSNKTLIKNFLIFLIVLKFVPTNLFGFNLNNTISPITGPIQRFMNHHLVRLVLFFLTLVGLLLEERHDVIRSPCSINVQNVNIIYII